MLDITREEYKSRILWFPTPELIVGKINDGEDDYVECIRCNRKHFILRGWVVEAHYPSMSTAMHDLDRFTAVALCRYRDYLEKEGEEND